MKSVFRVAAEGRPIGRDGAFDPDMTLVEERVVLFRARSHDEAIARARDEASAYCSEAVHRNPYGQRVVYRPLSPSDCFELFNPPASGREVYSRTEIVPRSVSNRSLLAALVGPGRESARVAASRRNLLEIAFNAPAEGVKRTDEEADLIRRALTQSRKRAPIKKRASNQALHPPPQGRRG